MIKASILGPLRVWPEHCAMGARSARLFSPESNARLLGCILACPYLHSLVLVHFSLRLLYFTVALSFLSATSRSFRTLYIAPSGLSVAFTAYSSLIPPLYHVTLLAQRASPYSLVTSHATRCAPLLRSLPAACSPAARQLRLSWASIREAP